MLSIWQLKMNWQINQESGNNNDHGNAYNREINALYDKLEMKNNVLRDQTNNFYAPVGQNFAHVDTFNKK